MDRRDFLLTATAATAVVTAAGATTPTAGAADTLNPPGIQTAGAVSRAFRLLQFLKTC